MARPKKLLENIEANGWDILDSLVLWANGEYCAEQLDIDYDTLNARIKEKHGVSFSEYKDKKKEKLRINLRKKQYDEAMNGNTTLLIWLGKNELGQTDKTEGTISHQGKPLTINYITKE